MSIPFRQYLRPNGHTRDHTVDRPADIEALAREFMARGGHFEAEVLTTGHVSLSAGMKVDGEWLDVVVKICNNGPEVLDAVDALVREAAAWKDVTT